MLGHHPDPIPRDVDWPALIRSCETRGVPALRFDRLGNGHVLRTAGDLAAFEQTTDAPTLGRLPYASTFRTAGERSEMFSYQSTPTGVSDASA